MKAACAAGGIGVPTDFRNVLLLTSKGVQAIVDLPSSDASSVSALSKKGDALRPVEAVEA